MVEILDPQQESSESFWKYVTNGRIYIILGSHGNSNSQVCPRRIWLLTNRSTIPEAIPKKKSWILVALYFGYQSQAALVAWNFERHHFSHTERFPLCISPMGGHLAPAWILLKTKSLLIHETLYTHWRSQRLPGVNCGLPPWISESLLLPCGWYPSSSLKTFYATPPLSLTSAQPSSNSLTISSENVPTLCSFLFNSFVLLQKWKQTSEN